MKPRELPRREFKARTPRAESREKEEGLPRGKCRLNFRQKGKKRRERWITARTKD